MSFPTRCPLSPTSAGCHPLHALSRPGCMLFGESTSYPQAEQLLGMCMEAGVNFFDTVRMCVCVCVWYVSTCPYREADCRHPGQQSQHVR